ncbi:MAG TPA: hypothetical protein VMV21_18135, partial [Vicinamibacteria bacterium]|nr:hypothetical protein [Vicinamibacteria bacterium]
MLEMWRTAVLVAASSGLLAPVAVVNGESRPCGTRADGSLRARVLHRYFEQSRGTSASGLHSTEAAPLDPDVGGVALLEDRGDLVVRRNPFDLETTSLRFHPNRRGGYDAARLEVGREPAGDPLPVASGSAALVELPFRFPFFGRLQDRAFVHADGSLTFGQAGLGSEPGLADFLAGPPRLAAFFASLDPSRAGAVTARLLPDRAVFDWRDVPGSGQINANSFQAILYPTGEIDLIFGEMQTHEGVVGLSPGEAVLVTAADL